MRVHTCTDTKVDTRNKGPFSQGAAKTFWFPLAQAAIHQLGASQPGWQGLTGMTCVIYHTGGARPQEENRPLCDKALRELSSTHNKASLSWDRRWQICGDGMHMDTRWHDMRGEETHTVRLSPRNHTLYPSCLLVREKSQLAVFKKTQICSQCILEGKRPMR